MSILFSPENVVEMLTPKARHIRFTTWAITGLEAGVFLFAAGLVALHTNPFWHFDEAGFLDSRVHWWNAGAEILAAAGLVIEVLAVLASLAVLISRFTKLSPWPYVVAASVVCGVLIWTGTEGFVITQTAHFEWNAAEGFTAFLLRPSSQNGADAQSAFDRFWQSIIQLQIQPPLRGYFRVNDWQKMNGDVGITTVRGVPIAWPVALGSGGESLEDPDETALMRAAEQQDLKTLQQLLSAASRADVNALDQGGQTALILACRYPKANPELVKALLAAGADVNLRARNGYAPLTWALARNNQDVIRILRRSGAKP